jgi:hypothetical protein
MRALLPEPSVPTAIPAPPAFPFSGAPFFSHESRTQSAAWIRPRVGWRHVAPDPATSRGLLWLAVFGHNWPLSLKAVFQLTRAASSLAAAWSRSQKWVADFVFACGDVFHRVTAKLLCARAAGLS